MSNIIKATAPKEPIRVPFACSLRFGDGEKLVFIKMKMSEYDLIGIDEIEMEAP